MTRSLRSLSAALVALVSLTLGAVPATADEPTVRCPFISVADSTKAAMAVFTGTVTEATRQEKPAGEAGAYYPVSYTHLTLPTILRV